MFMIAMYACIHIYHKLVYTHQLSVHQHACSINVATYIVLIASHFVLVRNYSLQCLFTTEQCFKIRFMLLVVARKQVPLYT